MARHNLRYYQHLQAFALKRAQKATSAKWRTLWFDLFDFASGMPDAL